MKTINTLFLLIAMLFSSSPLFAYDFEVDGIYYNITSYTEETVEVTYKGDRVSEYQDEYSGSVSIPRIVKRGNTMYRVTSIGNSAFYRCSGLTSVEIPNSVTSIGSSAFDYCSRLTSVEIPNSVTSIQSAAFSGCSGLTSVAIGNSVTSIGSSAFYYCSGLTSVTIPNSVTSIGNNAFSGCSGLTSIVVDEGNSVYDSRNNCNAIIETSTNSLISGCKTTKIPNSVTSIGLCAFSDCSGLTSVTIPNSVTSISWFAFSGCSGLTSVVIGNSVTSIGSSAFDYCSGLTSIEIPNSVTIIGWSAFSGCSGLTSVVIGNSVTSIGSYAFYGCSGLTSVTIPNSVTSIGESAFMDCSGLTSVTIGNSVKSIGESAFYGCDNIWSIYIATVNPPSVGSNNFDTTDYTLIDLYVPEESLSAYKNHSVWGKFKFIYTFDATGIEGVEMDNELVNDAPVYSLSGVRMQSTDNLPKGVYIRNGKKFMVK